MLQFVNIVIAAVDDYGRGSNRKRANPRRHRTTGSIIPTHPREWGNPMAVNAWGDIGRAME